MRVLIACEHSGRIRDAFTALGYDATSCDLLPSETPGKHIQGDVRKVLKNGWDLLIGHPPCGYISYVANGHWTKPGRAKKRLQALTFFNTLWSAPIPHICIENPLGCADAVIAKHSQIIHPYYFGDREMKRTCLWLKNLPQLSHIPHDDLFSVKTHTAVPEPTHIHIRKPGKNYKGTEIKKRYFVDAIGGYHGEGNSFKRRSVTFPGIANAMAAQWGPLVSSKINAG